MGSPRRPSVRLGVALYLGYLSVFFTTWTINRVDYTRIGQDATTAKLWYALPTLFGCVFLFVAISTLGWWRIALFDRTRSGPWWAWALPVLMTLVIANNVRNVDLSRVSPTLLLWLILGGIGVGFGEELATRGSLLVGLRSAMSERKAWLASTLFFAALHIPNVFFGLPADAMPVQVVLTFIMGSGLYAIRRLSGTLLLPIALHGLWDSSLFLSVAADVTASPIQFAVYPVAVICAFGVLARGDRRRHPRTPTHRNGYGEQG